MNISKKNIKPGIPKGVYPVMLTAFREDGSLDFQGVDHLTDYYLQSNVTGLFACAMSAEVNHLSDLEKTVLAEHIVQHVDYRVPIVAGALSAGSLIQQIELVRRISGIGADIVTVAVSQIADKNEDDQVWLHNMDSFLQEIPDNIRLGLYESPWPYRRLLSEETFRWVVQSERFYFLKDTCSQIDIIRSRVKIRENSALSLFNANTQTLLASLQAGADGFSGIGANYFPELYVWLCGNFKEFPEMSCELQDFMTKCCEIMEGKFYPVLAKEYLRQKGIHITPFCRSKRIKLPVDAYESLKQLRTEADKWLCKINTNSAL
ncbi:MAG: dihydrodipicolinate synthase family protein [Chlamydiae bacterium]|nr:MAG: dihydrodipicolinate synthase family protein [Chlamydiota bacterium]